MKTYINSHPHSNEELRKIFDSLYSVVRKDSKLNVLSNRFFLDLCEVLDELSAKIF